MQRFLRVVLLVSAVTTFVCLAVLSLRHPTIVAFIHEQLYTLSNYTPPELAISEDLIRFRSMKARYLKTLASHDRHKYSSSENYKTKGLPVSSVLNEKDTNATVKKVLAWTPFFGKQDWIPKTICRGPRTCISSTDKNELANSDGIVVHPRDLRQKTDLPTGLLPHQRLIYLLQESPYATGINVGDYDGVFNWTATYRRDSDIPFTYFSTEPKPELMSETESEKLVKDIISSKSKLIAYMNSNCFAPHTKRLQFVSQLGEHIRVDTYGRCGRLECPRNNPECTHTMSQYKFYLALENAHCRDYVTEKVVLPLMSWKAVPVVMGGADPGDYEAILPPNSYIHTSGFSSAKDLAEYLQLLDRNPDLYAEYHVWRRTHQRGSSDHWCSICQALHNTSLPIQYYSNFKGWYQEDVCKA